MNTVRSKRGPYKRYLKDPSFPIPKQTLWNWRKRDSYIATTINTCHAQSHEASIPLSLAVDQPAGDSCSDEETEASPSQLMSSDSPTYWESPTNSGAEEEVGAAYNSPTSGEENNCSDELDITAHASDIIPSTSSPALSLLYPGAKISVATGILLLHSLTKKHGLTQAALADILQLLHLHLPEK